MPIIAPSILAADFTQLGDAIEMINRSQADWIHCDVMDGKFVPNISFGMPVLEQVKKIAQKPLDVHLMIVEPERYLSTFQQCGADILTVHIEACVHLHRTLSAIKELGMRAGVAINPSTPVEMLSEVLYLTDVVCMMSVNPGFGGQKFIPSTYAKIRRLKEMIQESEAQTLIEIDGGVNQQTAPPLLAAGADVLVAGNFVFSSPTPLQTIQELKRLQPEIHV
jgi:ribulose-phosphate 3-epimerase